MPCRPVISLLHRHGLEGKKILGYIGSFYYYEGLNDLLELMALVKKERDDVRLLLVGGGDEYETIRKKA